MKKKVLIGLCSFFAALGVAAIALAIYVWPVISPYIPMLKAVDWSLVTTANIEAVYKGMTMTPEELAAEKTAIDRERTEKIRTYVDMALRDYTPEEKAQIASGEKSESQILAGIITETIDKQENQNNNGVQGEVTGSPDKVETKPNKETAEKIVARHVSELYKIQADFEGRVAALASSASNWVKAYHASHPGTTWRDAKVAGVSNFTSTASKIETDCYGKVDAQMELLRKELKAIGADTSIVDTIKSTAYSEMEARKAEIVNQGYAKLNKKD